MKCVDELIVFHESRIVIVWTVADLKTLFDGF